MATLEALTTESKEWQMLHDADTHNIALDECRTMLDAYSSMVRLREESMLLQSEAAHKIQSCSYAYQHTQQSAREMISQLGHGNRTEDPGTAALMGQLSSDGELFQAQMQTTIESLAQQQSQQLHLAQAEDRFNQALKHFVISLPRGFALWNDMQQTQPQTPQNLPQERDDIPEIAQDYFEAVGVLGNLRERKMDAERERMDERARRSRLQDQEEELSTTDSQFEAHHNAEMSALQGQIDDILQQAEDLLQHCEKNGIDVESIRQRFMNGSDESESPGRLPPTSFIGAFNRSVRAEAGKDVAIIETMFPGEDGGGVPDIKDRIEDWLARSSSAESPPQSGETASSEAMTENAETAAQSVSRAP